MQYLFRCLLSRISQYCNLKNIVLFTIYFMLSQCQGIDETPRQFSSDYLIVDRCVTPPLAMRDVTSQILYPDFSKEDLDIFSAFRIFSSRSDGDFLYIKRDVSECWLRVSGADGGELVPIDPRKRESFYFSFLDEVHERISSLERKCYDNNYPVSKEIFNLGDSAYSEPLLYCDYYSKRNSLVLGFENVNGTKVVGIHAIVNDIFFWEIGSGRI